jgi:hypothetical protein
VREDWSIDWDGPNTLSISGRPIYVKTDLGNVDRLKTQIQTAAARPKRDFPNG